MGLEFILAKSVDTLPAQTQRLFTALAAFATAEFGRFAILSLAQAIGISENEAGQCLAPLVQCDLITTPNIISSMPEDSDRERFWLQPLLRAFAQKRLKTWHPTEQQQIQRAIAAHYASYVNNKKVSWGACGYDERNIAGALEWAHDQQEDELIAELCSGMQRFWLECGRTEDALRYLPWGITAAEARASIIDPRAATLHLTYATILHHTYRLQEAEKELNKIETIRASETLNVLGEIALDRSELVKAEDFFRRSLESSRSENNLGGMGRALSNLGRIALLRGHLKEAEEYCKQSIPLRRKVEDKAGEAWDINCLGEVALNRGQLDEAERNYQQSLDVLGTIGNTGFLEGIIRSNLIRITLCRGHLDEAEQGYQESLKIRQHAKDRQGEAWDTACLGEIALLHGNLDEAEEYFRRSLDMYTQVQFWRGKGIILSYLGKLALLREQLDKAEGYLQQSLPIRREVGDRRGEGWDLLHLGQIAEQRGDMEGAERFYRRSLYIRREVASDLDSANSLLHLGRILIEKLGKREEGWTLLSEAVRLYPEQWVPGLADAVRLPVDMSVPGKEQARRVAQAMELSSQVLKPNREFAVFLCHNMVDKPAVKKIGEQLKEHGILPWLDEWELQPGLPWQQVLEKQIEHIKAAAVFIGKSGRGPWQDMGLSAFIRQFVKRKCPVIPVILPDCDVVPPLPTFLEGMTWVDFRKQDPDPMKGLIWGITGERIGSF